MDSGFIRPVIADLVAPGAKDGYELETNST